MTTEELQRLVSGYDKSCGVAQSSKFSDPLERASVELARELIAARRVVEASALLCERVEQQQNGWPMRADYVPNALLPTQDALSAYEEAKG